MNNKGFTLVLLVIVIALIFVLGTTVLNVVMKQYEIKRFNTDTKQSFYMAETGLNEAYVRSCILINESIIKGVQMAEDYLSINPSNVDEAKNTLVTNFELNLSSNIKNRTETSANPSVEIRNQDPLTFSDDIMKVFLRSSYTNENGVEKLVWVELFISVPKFDDVIDGVYDADDYIEFANWNS